MVVEDCLVVRDVPQPHWHWVQNCSAGETLLSQAGGVPGLLPCFRLPPGPCSGPVSTTVVSGVTCHNYWHLKRWFSVLVPHENSPRRLLKIPISGPLYRPVNQNLCWAQKAPL